MLHTGPPKARAEPPAGSYPLQWELVHFHLVLVGRCQHPGQAGAQSRQLLQWESEKVSHPARALGTEEGQPHGGRRRRFRRARHQTDVQAPQLWGFGGSLAVTGQASGHRGQAQLCLWPAFGDKEFGTCAHAGTRLCSSPTRPRTVCGQDTDTVVTCLWPRNLGQTWDVWGRV